VPYSSLFCLKAVPSERVFAAAFIVDSRCAAREWRTSCISLRIKLCSPSLTQPIPHAIVAPCYHRSLPISSLAPVDAKAVGVACTPPLASQIISRPPPLVRGTAQVLAHAYLAVIIKAAAVKSQRPGLACARSSALSLCASKPCLLACSTPTVLQVAASSVFASSSSSLSPLPARETCKPDRGIG
jgi:hypothetical protein